MNYIDVVLFILTYIPFWAVPLAMMSTHFAYLYWLKDFREMAYVWAAITLFCLTSVAVYFLIGGPDQLVQTFRRVFH